jgi:hypothetical protein
MDRSASGCAGEKFAKVRDDADHTRPRSRRTSTGFDVTR